MKLFYVDYSGCGGEAYIVRAKSIEDVKERLKKRAEELHDHIYMEIIKEIEPDKHGVYPLGYMGE